MFQTVTVHMTDEEMDNFVFAVLPKKTATKMQKELQDLVENLRLWKTNTLIFVMLCLDTPLIIFTFFCCRPSSALINVVAPSMIFLPHMLC